VRSSPPVPDGSRGFAANGTGRGVIGDDAGAATGSAKRATAWPGDTAAAGAGADQVANRHEKLEAAIYRVGASAKSMARTAPGRCGGAVRSAVFYANFPGPATTSPARAGRARDRPRRVLSVLELRSIIRHSQTGAPAAACRRSAGGLCRSSSRGSCSSPVSPGPPETNFVVVRSYNRTIWVDSSPHTPSPPRAGVAEFRRPLATTRRWPGTENARQSFLRYRTARYVVRPRVSTDNA
jgi:hypothetical protein